MLEMEKIAKSLFYTLLIISIAYPLIIFSASLYRRGVWVNNGTALNMCQILDTKSALVERVAGKRLILFGYSNVATGLRASDLKQALGVPVVNFGLFANISDGMAFSSLERLLRPGDVVLISMNFRFFNQDDNVRSQRHIIRDLMFSLEGNSIFRMPARYWIEMIFTQSPAQLFEAISRKSGFGSPAPLQLFQQFGLPEMGGAFNADGDYPGVAASSINEAMRQRVKQTAYALSTMSVKQDGDGLHQMRLLSQRAKDIGATVLAIWPPAFVVGERQKSSFLDEYTSAHNGLGVQLLGRSEDFLYPADWFSDSANHLTNEAAIRYTATVAQILADHPKIRALALKAE